MPEAAPSILNFRNIEIFRPSSSRRHSAALRPSEVGFPPQFLIKVRVFRRPERLIQNYGAVLRLNSANAFSRCCAWLTMGSG